MLLRNPRETALLARIIQNSKCLFSIRSQSDDGNNQGADEKIKQLNKENFSTFGKLHETKREKVRRKKLELNGKVPVAKTSKFDSELAFVLGTTNKSCLSLKKIKKTVHKDFKNFKNITPRASNFQPVFELNNATNKVSSTTGNSRFSDETSSTTLKSTEDLESIKLNQCVSNSSVENNQLSSNNPIKSSNQSSSEIENVSKVDKKNILFPRDFLPNLIETPVFVKYKSFDEYAEPENSQVLSISPMEARACLKYPSVTKVLSATQTEESKMILEKWKQKMIDKLGAKGFESYQEELFASGKLFHATVMDKLMGQPSHISDKIKPAVTSLDEVLKNIQKVRAVETHAIHPKLMYRGVVDCVATYRGELCLIDWKKSDKPKHTIHDTYDAPVQLASYIGAINADLKYPFMIKKGLVIIAYTNGDPAKVHVINEGTLQMYWKLWLERLTEYHAALDPA